MLGHHHANDRLSSAEQRLAREPSAGLYGIQVPANPRKTRLKKVVVTSLTNLGFKLGTRSDERATGNLSTVSTVEFRSLYTPNGPRT
jgi:hypothetical protein